MPQHHHAERPAQSSTGRLVGCGCGGDKRTWYGPPVFYRWPGPVGRTCMVPTSAKDAAMRRLRDAKQRLLNRRANEEQAAPWKA